MDNIKMRVRKLIKESGLTIGEFANKIGTHQSSLSRALSDNNNVGDAMINKITIAFDINKDWLLTGEGSMLKSDAPPVSKGKSTCQSCKDKLEFIQSQKEIIRSKDEIIQMLKEKVVSMEDINASLQERLAEYEDVKPKREPESKKPVPAYL